MKALVGLTLVVAACLGGCATDPNASQEFSRIHAFEVGDLQLSCQSLRDRIEAIDRDMNTINQKIGNEKGRAAIFAALGSIYSSLGVGGVNLSGFGESMATQEVGELAAVRESYNQRRTVLMQQFYAKRCTL